jgi:hypothetical protein
MGYQRINLNRIVFGVLAVLGLYGPALAQSSSLASAAMTAFRERDRDHDGS